MTRMEPFRKRLAANLSGGMKQKLALMCTLLHHPQVLFLDEPTNGVDPVSRRDFWAILYQLVRDGLTVFVTTAYLDEAERCNRVGLMNQGRMIRCETPQALEMHAGRNLLRGGDFRPARRARVAALAARRLERGTYWRKAAPVSASRGSFGRSTRASAAGSAVPARSSFVASFLRSKTCSSA